MFSNELLDQQTLGTDDPEGVKARKQKLIAQAQSLGLSVRATESAASIIASIEDRQRQLKIEAEMQANYQQFLEEEARKEVARNARKAKIEAEMAENYREFQKKAEEKQRKQEEKQRQKEEERKARRAAQGASEEKPEEGKPSGATVGQVVSGLGGGLGGVLVFVAGKVLQGAGKVAGMAGDLTSAAISSVQDSAQPSPAPVQPSTSPRQTPSSASGAEPPYVDDGRIEGPSSEDRSARQTPKTAQGEGREKPAETPTGQKDAEQVETGPITYGDIDTEGKRPSGLPGLHTHGPDYVAPNIVHPPAPIHIRDAVEAVWNLGEALTNDDLSAVASLQPVADAALSVFRGGGTPDDFQTINMFLGQHGHGPIDPNTSISDERPTDSGAHEEAIAEPSISEENTESSEPDAGDAEDEE